MIRHAKRGFVVCKLTSPSHLFGGPFNGIAVGPNEMSSNNLAKVRPLRYCRSLPKTCHQKFSKRRAVGS